MNAPIIIAPVRKSVRVKAPVARAFDVFTSGLSRWWPLDHGVPANPVRLRFQATLRCGEPVQLQLWVGIFCLQSR